MDYKDYNDYELIEYINEGNEEANNILIKKYEPLIIKIATKMLPYCKNNGLEKNDLIQEGMVGLSHALDRYQEQKDTLFYTYAKTCIERKIISVVIGSNRNKNKILNESISYDNEENLLLKFMSDTKQTPEEAVLNVAIEEDLVNRINEVLTDLEQQVFTLLINGFKYKEIAEILDKDQKSIDNAIQRIKTKIKRDLKK